MFRYEMREADGTHPPTMIWCSQDLKTLLWRRVDEETVCGALPISEVCLTSSRFVLYFTIGSGCVTCVDSSKQNGGSPEVSHFQTIPFSLSLSFLDCGNSEL